ncbi:phospholipase A, partial [Enterobacter hormaechei]|uniref:phospholipase A n=1 Tax=Enterobacter hormaechei TaxID=158836 RepID=UPI00197A8A78
LWRGILGPNSVLGASYTQKSWWQLSNSDESSPFRETNYEPQLFLGFATDYNFAGWTLWRGILGPNSVLGASYTQKSWWQLSNSDESSP